MSILDTISHCDFLRDIPASLQAKLQRIADSRSYPVGTVIFIERSVHPDFHIIESGLVRLDMFVPRRGRVPILTAGSGDILAWSALVGNSVMTTTAIALEPVKTVVFSGDALRQLCETEHEVGYHVMRQLAMALSKRLVATRLQLLDLFGEHVPVLNMTSAVGRPGDPEC